MAVHDLVVGAVQSANTKDCTRDAFDANPTLQSIGEDEAHDSLFVETVRTNRTQFDEVDGLLSPEPDLHLLPRSFGRS